MSECMQKTAKIQKPMPQQAITGLILAGGKSARMGTDKALLDWQGKTWLAQMAEILQQAGVSNIVVSRNSITQFTTVNDAFIDGGPLSGLYSAIKQADILSPMLVVPIDMPMLCASALTELVESTDNIDEASCYQNSPLPLFIKPTQQHIDLLFDQLSNPDSKKSIWQFLKKINTRQLNKQIDTPNFNSLKDIP